MRSRGGGWWSFSHNKGMMEMIGEGRQRTRMGLNKIAAWTTEQFKSIQQD